MVERSDTTGSESPGIRTPAGVPSPRIFLPPRPAQPRRPRSQRRHQAGKHYEDLHDSVGRFDFVLANPELNDEIYQVIDEAGLDDDQEEKLKQVLGKRCHLITREERLDAVAKVIVHHFLSRGYAASLPAPPAA